MVKTKTRSKAKATLAVSLPEKNLIKANNKTCLTSSCGVCSLFKVMVVLFVVMIIFWLGFCLGDLSLKVNNGLNYRAMSTNKPGCGRGIKLGDNMCPGNPINELNAKTKSVLSGLIGDAFDKEFLLEMTLNHQSDIEIARLALEKSTREEIKTLAQQTIETRTKAIEQMKLWQANWFAIK